MADIAEIMTLSPVIPVVTVQDADQAVSIARALSEGGVSVIEITRRTSAAFEAIDAVRRELPEMYVGAGTVWTAEQAEQALEAGARFIVSPGVADAVDDVCRERGVAYLPGAQTVSELAHLAARGRYCAKLFPAAALGGPTAIKAYASVHPDMTFCPTGGIDAETAGDYLALPSVACVGGSWLTPAAAVKAGDWDAVRLEAKNTGHLKTA
ncbi:bifunctional 4-hydroxy-2-oxoglutarate aldolase/2-dehydro-3-deoxy-phosphogluconate aldolase [Salinisphaera orenii]|uniref:bifunctional 4-hydroxy-2-oxoglutarate aldolase/2-dehydro-3-deoxy-phosphogluconate aldolase n=1 Tax=Salinisphaera orenii TaxID=856731 RepID=UPI000DBE6B75